MSRTLRTVDLFCGAGGLSLGFQQQGFSILVGTDYHPDPCDTFEGAIGTPAVARDITEISPARLMDEGGFDPEDVDVVIGGPPCKGFSLAGERDPDDPRNYLFRQYIEMVRAFNPSAIVMENVTGILSMKDGRYKDQILKKLRRLGYNTNFEILNAANYGVPQRRNRVIFIGHKPEITIDYPAPIHSKTDGTQTLAELGGHKSYIRVKDAISDLDFLGPGESSEKYENPPESEYQEKMRKNSDTLHNHTAPNHSERIQKRFELMKQGKGMESVPEEYQTKKQRMIKLDPNDMVDTITTLPEDFVHYSQDRIPTVRELARLQSFPDDFKFEGPRTTGGQRRTESVPQYSQVGNAVPPRLAAAIAKEVKAGLLASKSAV